MNIFRFDTKEEVQKWHTENDGVMGGVSTSSISFIRDHESGEGCGLFKGNVSLENNGGFAQILYKSEILDLSKFKGLELILKGDGKKYQIRIETTAKNAGYSCSFTTTNDWSTSKISFAGFTADHHGEPVPDAPEFDLQNIKTLGILIGNNKAESFSLMIKKIQGY